MLQNPLFPDIGPNWGSLQRSVKLPSRWGGTGVRLTAKETKISTVVQYRPVGEPCGLRRSLPLLSINGSYTQLLDSSVNCKFNSRPIFVSLRSKFQTDLLFNNMKSLMRSMPRRVKVIAPHGSNRADPRTARNCGLAVDESLTIHAHHLRQLTVVPLSRLITRQVAPSRVIYIL